MPMVVAFKIHFLFLCYSCGARILQTARFVRGVTKTILGFSLVPKSHLVSLCMTLYQVTATSPVRHSNTNFLSFSRFPFCVTGVNIPQTSQKTSGPLVLTVPHSPHTNLSLIQGVSPLICLESMPST